MQNSPEQTYLDLMSSIRDRLDLIVKLSQARGNDFGRAETAAFHGRKVIEGIAFGCLVATEKGLKYIPRNAKGQWNAETIIKDLQKKGLNTFPSPSLSREASPEERSKNNITVTIEGIPDRGITINELATMYHRMHRWLHEPNPYLAKDKATFYKNNSESLWFDLLAIEKFIERHFISLSGQGFFLHPARQKR